MTDFRKIHTGVPYWGVWADETADDYGRRDALDVLAAAVERCRDEDMRQDGTVAAALAYLAGLGWGKRVRGFRVALDVQNPDERQQAAFSAWNALQP